MIKLHFEPIHFKNINLTCEGKINAILKFNNKILRNKLFTTRITLHKGDTFDLNKAYRYIQASLEKKAYEWANNIISKELKSMKVWVNNCKTFVNKAKYIVNHDTEYLKTF